jgi:hypothetical protein
MENDELLDLALAEEIVFSGLGLKLERYGNADLNTGKTPDWRVTDRGVLCAYCEVKSPRDNWLEDKLQEASAPSIVGGLRNDPVFNRIRRHIERSIEQFRKVNTHHEVPNILIFVNHDSSSSFADLRETLTGCFFTEDGRRIPTMPDQAARLTGKMANVVDLVVWIDAKDRSTDVISDASSSYPSFVEKFASQLRSRLGP